jgi:hypothetical protein
MNKLFSLVSIALLLMATPCSAQGYEEEHSMIHLGVTGGLNIESVWTENSSLDVYTDKVRPGFFIGPTLFCETPIKGLGFDFSVLFDQRGVRSESYPNVSIKSQSFQFPLNFRYGINFENMLMPYVFFGPQLAVNVGKKEVPIATGSGSSTQHPMVLLWEPKPLVVSLNFGIGVVAMDKVQARVSYNLALRRTGWFERVDLVTGERRFISVGKLNACQVAITYFF